MNMNNFFFSSIISRIQLAMHLQRIRHALRHYGDCAANALRLRCELIRSGVAVKFAKVRERQYFICSLQHCLNFESHILTEVVLRFYVRYNHLAPTQYLGLVEWNPTWLRFLFGSGSWYGILPYDRCWTEACELLTHSPLPKLCTELTINVSLRLKEPKLS